MAARVTARPANAPEGRRAMFASYLEIGASGVFLVVVVLVSLVSFLYLLQVGSVATTGYQIRDLEHQKADLQRENQQLRYQQAQLRSLGRIENIATTRLGMQRGEQTRFLALQDDTTRETASDQQQNGPEVSDGRAAPGLDTQNFQSRLGLPADTGSAGVAREKH